jgi:hypothetical protein
MAGFTQEHKRIVDYVEAQGVTVTRTTKGLLFRAPNNETTVLHWTESDWRSTRNFRANLKRMGVEYPGDHSNDKKRKTPTKVSIERIQEALKDMDPNNVNGRELRQRVPNMSIMTINSVMQYLGYWHEFKPKGSTRTTVWHPPYDPKEIIEPVEDMKNLVEYADDTTDKTDANSTSLDISAVEAFSQAVHNTPDNSWPVQLDHLDGTITIDQLRIIYMAAGLNVEMRVWR